MKVVLTSGKTEFLLLQTRPGSCLSWILKLEPFGAGVMIPPTWNPSSTALEGSLTLTQKSLSVVAISDFFASLVEGYGIRLIPFICGGADEVLNAYLEDAPGSPRFMMKGCPHS